MERAMISIRTYTVCYKWETLTRGRYQKPRLPGVLSFQGANKRVNTKRNMFSWRDNPQCSLCNATMYVSINVRNKSISWHIKKHWHLCHTKEMTGRVLHVWSILFAACWTGKKVGRVSFLCVLLLHLMYIYHHTVYPHNLQLFAICKDRREPRHVTLRDSVCLHLWYDWVWMCTLVCLQLLWAEWHNMLLSRAHQRHWFRWTGKTPSFPQISKFHCNTQEMKEELVLLGACYCQNSPATTTSSKWLKNRDVEW